MMPAGYVKPDDETNDEYLASFIDHTYETPDLWLEIIFDAHKKMLAIDPSYEISQIKEKFGGLRYYFDTKFDWNSPEAIAMNAIIGEAEKRVAELESSRRANNAQDKSDLQKWDDEGGVN